MENDVKQRAEALLDKHTADYQGRPMVEAKGIIRDLLAEREGLMPYQLAARNGDTADGLVIFASLKAQEYILDKNRRIKELEAQVRSASDAEYRHLEAGEIIQEGDEVDGCRDGWKDAPKWEKVKHGIGTPASDPRYPSHSVYRRKRETGDAMTAFNQWILKQGGNVSGEAHEYEIFKGGFQAGCASKREDWQPIETAPKDDTDILVYGYRDVDWDNNGNEVYSNPYTEISQYEDRDYKRGYNHRNGAPNVTHWKPLPAAPEAIRSLKGEQS